MQPVGSLFPNQGSNPGSLLWELGVSATGPWGSPSVAFVLLYWLHASLVAEMVKNLPAMREIWVQPLGREDVLGREWLPTPVFLPGEFHGEWSLAGSMGSQRAGHDWATDSHGSLRSEHCEAVTVLSVGLHCMWHSAWKVTKCLWLTETQSCLVPSERIFSVLRSWMPWPPPWLWATPERPTSVSTAINLAFSRLLLDTQLNRKCSLGEYETTAIAKNSGNSFKKKKDDRIHTYGVCRCLKVILETLESSNKEESGL